MVVLTHTNIELRLSCQNLKNKDLFSKSDPQIVVFEFNPVRSPLHAGTLLNSKLSGDERRTFWSSSSGPSDPNAWREIGRTEVIRDDLNPKFITKISMPFIFEEMQLLRFVVLDIDSQAFRIEDHDLLGVYEIPLSGIVSAQGLKKPLLRGGTISIVANEVSENKRNVNLQFSGRGLDKKDFFGKSDPYYVISRIIGQHSVAVFKSEVIKKTLDPNWRPICLPLNEICG
ncbi:Copine-8, partial [Nowakowskiella sp. JEL0078]